jgi:predicted enzyme related to lactoylglutathione lyase
MSRVIWFEIPADDPERAAKFYEDVFGWEVEKWEGPFDYWLIKTGPEEEPGIHGAIMTKDMGEVIRDTIGVDNYDEFAEKIESEARCLVKKLTFQIWVTWAHLRTQKATSLQL